MKEIIELCGSSNWSHFEDILWKPQLPITRKREKVYQFEDPQTAFVIEKRSSAGKKSNPRDGMVIIRQF